MALKLAHAASALGDEGACVEALGWAAPCEGDFTASVAREALAAREARRGDYAAARVEVDSLETADTEATRRALASADDLRPLAGGLLSAWWD